MPIARNVYVRVCERAELEMLNLPNLSIFALTTESGPRRPGRGLPSR